MKSYVIPYVVGKNGKWGAGIDIYNHSNIKTAVTVSIYRNFDGSRAQKFDIQIEKYCHYVLTPDIIDKNLLNKEKNKGRATVTIDSSEVLMITPIQQGADGGLAILNVFEDTQLKN